MKLVLFNDYVPGLLKGDSVIDISSIAPMGRDGQATMQGLIERFDGLRPRLEQALATGAGVPLSSVRLRAPLPRPGKIVAMGANYLENVPNGAPVPILVFLKSPAGVMDQGGTCTLPPIDFVICHHEAELVLVFGKRGKSVPAAGWRDYVFGYTCGVDVSARGQYGGNRFMGKSFDGFSPLGPCIVTKDEIPDPQNLQVRFWVDGQPRHDFNTNDMAYKIPRCIEYVSSIMTLAPGDVLFTGTNHQGIGPLQDGETAEIEIERIGRFSFKVSDPLKRTWPKEIDKGMANFVREQIEKKGVLGATIDYQKVSGSGGG